MLTVTPATLAKNRIYGSFEAYAVVIALYLRALTDYVATRNRVPRETGVLTTRHFPDASRFHQIKLNSSL